MNSNTSLLEKAVEKDDLERKIPSISLSPKLLSVNIKGRRERSIVILLILLEINHLQDTYFDR